MKKAVVCVSFGTSVPAGRENITAVENVLRQAAQDRIFVSAFTSGVIRRILKERGETVRSVAEALEEEPGLSVEQVPLLQKAGGASLTAELSYEGTPLSVTVELRA